MSNCRRKLRILTLPNECVSKDLEYVQDNDSEGDLDNSDCSRIEYSGKGMHETTLGMDNKKINHNETVTNRTIDQYEDSYDKVLRNCEILDIINPSNSSAVLNNSKATAINSKWKK
ncbi:hypothetical protein GQX74_006240 [Glossina fuscipes]|nr:hypothetical protein GQX74_006240 [Glossina fuscipes]